MEAMTWRCHVCGAERPDDIIAVYHEVGRFGQAEVRYNVRHCRDRAECVAGAPSVVARWRDSVDHPRPVSPGESPA